MSSAKRKQTKKPKAGLWLYFFGSLLLSTVPTKTWQLTLVIAILQSTRGHMLSHDTAMMRELSHDCCQPKSGSESAPGEVREEVSLTSANSSLYEQLHAHTFPTVTVGNWSPVGRTCAWCRFWVTVTVTTIKKTIVQEQHVIKKAFSLMSSLCFCFVLSSGVVAPAWCLSGFLLLFYEHSLTVSGTFLVITPSPAPNYKIFISFDKIAQYFSCFQLMKTSKNLTE